MKSVVHDGAAFTRVATHPTLKSRAIVAGDRVGGGGLSRRRIRRQAIETPGSLFPRPLGPDCELMAYLLNEFDSGARTGVCHGGDSKSMIVIEVQFLVSQPGCFFSSLSYKALRPSLNSNAFSSFAVLLNWTRYLDFHFSLLLGVQFNPSRCFQILEM